MTKPTGIGSCLLTVASLVALSCTDYPIDPDSNEASLAATSASGPLTMTREGEFLGDVFVNGAQDTSTNLYFLFEAFDQATREKLVAPLGDELWLDPSRGWLIEYWDPRGGVECVGQGNDATLEGYWNGGREPEVHKPSPTSPLASRGIVSSLDRTWPH